jgi:bifunctional non-homologous end joining protein LigD
MRQQHSSDVVFCAFDLVELDGKDFTAPPIENPQEYSEIAAARQACGHPVQRALHADGAIVYREACALGCEGVVSKRPNRAMREGSVSLPTSHTSDHFAEVRRLSV